MNNNSWIAPYAVLSTVVFISSTLFLFSDDHPKLVLHKVTIISFYPMHSERFNPIQVNPNDPPSCVNDLYNQFQTGNLDSESLQEGIDRCFGMSTNNGDNNSLIIPPQTQAPTGTTPRFV